MAENLYLGRFPTKNYGPLKVIDHKKMYAETEKWLKEVKMDFDPKAQLGTLSIGQMQSVEIAKAVSQQAKVVIFDEPTSSLSDNEVEALFRIMNDLVIRVLQWYTYPTRWMRSSVSQTISRSCGTVPM